MKVAIVLCLLQLIFMKHLKALSVDEEYWMRRAYLLQAEEVIGIGGRVILTSDEKSANIVLMSVKAKEINESFANPANFPPARNFLDARSEIEQSQIFKILKKMPKGAVLHAHDTAIVCEDFIYHNITFWNNLYVCDQDGELIVKFFNVPPNECNWRLLSDLRANKTIASDINNRIRKKLSMASDNPDIDYPTVDAAWAKFMEIFIFITPMLTYRPVYEAHFYQGLKELYDDNILYLELRSTLPPLYELDGTEYNALKVLEIYKNVTERFIADYPDFVGVKIIYAPLRYMTSTQLDDYVNLAVKMKQNFPDFLAGIDLVGQEDKGGALKTYAEKLQYIVNDVGAFFHAGETNWYGTNTDENLIDAVLLNTKRIGHGYAIVKHPKVMELLKEKNIAIEICPISNQVLGLVKDLRNHPASILFAEDYPVVISNDDPGLWGSKAVSYDFYEAFMGMMSKKADIRALKELSENSITYSSMSANQRKKAIEIWQQKWSEFIIYLNSLYTSPKINFESKLMAILLQIF